MSMHNAPAIRLTAKYHRRSQLLRGGLGLGSQPGTDHFRLYEIGKVDAYHPAYFLSGASASGIFFTDPAQPIRDVLPSAFHTAEATAKGNIIGMGP
jgi:hypothetical protein